MRKTTGHIIRISGLVIEMVGIWAVYQTNGDKDQTKLQLPGGTEVPLAFIVIGVGFVLWLTGTLLIYAGRPRARYVDDNPSESSV